MARRPYLKKRRHSLKVLISAVIFLALSVTFFCVHWTWTYNPGKFVINGPFNLGTYEFDRATLSGKEQDIAWKLYVQLTTRKAAMPYDEENDIIAEVYDSWYQLFSSTRDYLIEMPAKDLEGNENAQAIVKLSVDVLNDGLRPHLTKWQGKYRKWYDSALQKEVNKDLSPQEIQRQYPQYEEIISDIREVNAELKKYAFELKRFSHEEPPSFSTRAVGWVKDIWSKSR
ncbi:hypothetical protein [Bacillus sp. 3255]|uniref:hypothetical protein n=1 Tax=Bacillus sp. 3255 TaxID=2817904 RepID=UPI002856915C|nr:hypothetical protein [Bacillus sp. 3255]MDR6883003.1 hypothetical protein [Bacillus sp. 3255]